MHGRHTDTGSWHCHKCISIEDFADLLCHDCINNKFSDITSEETTIVIPGTPEVPMSQASQTTKQSTASDESKTFLNRCILVSDAQIIVSSLTQSRASALHYTKIHDIVKLEENETRSDPTTLSLLCTKWLQCKVCRKKTAYKCSECTPTFSLCKNPSCLQTHHLAIQKKTNGPHCWQGGTSVEISEPSHAMTWLNQVTLFLHHPIESWPCFSFYFFVKIFST